MQGARVYQLPCFTHCFALYTRVHAGMIASHLWDPAAKVGYHGSVVSRNLSQENLSICGVLALSNPCWQGCINIGLRDREGTDSSTRPGNDFIVSLEVCCCQRTPGDGGILSGTHGPTGKHTVPCNKTGLVAVGGATSVGITHCVAVACSLKRYEVISIDMQIRKQCTSHQAKRPQGATRPKAAMPTNELDTSARLKSLRQHGSQKPGRTMHTRSTPISTFRLACMHSERNTGLANRKGSRSSRAIR